MCVYDAIFYLFIYIYIYIYIYTHTYTPYIMQGAPKGGWRAAAPTQIEI